MEELRLDTTKINMVSEAEFTSRKMYEFTETFGSFTLSRGMYNNLKSMLNGVEIEYRKDPESAFNEFMRDMDALDVLFQDGVPGAPLTEEETEAMRFIDGFLGQLGMTMEYPIRKDRLYLSKFINADYRSITEERAKQLLQQG